MRLMCRIMLVAVMILSILFFSSSFNRMVVFNICLDGTQLVARSRIERIRELKAQIVELEEKLAAYESGDARNDQSDPPEK